MIYLDSSVTLAHLLAEDREPPADLWRRPLVASRLLEYEVWNRINAHGPSDSHGEPARALVHRLVLIEMEPPVLERALQPFPVPVRTLDALHLAWSSCALGQRVELASYDERLLAAARALGIEIAGL